LVKKYIERKTLNGRFLNHRGPAVIAEVTFSKSGKTIYYKGLELKRPASNEQSCIYGNYYDSADIDEFWVSGVKKRGSNRYPGYERHPVVEEGDL
jgi:hypothetical protein